MFANKKCPVHGTPTELGEVEQTSDQIVLDSEMGFAVVITCKSKEERDMLGAMLKNMKIVFAFEQ